MGTHNNFKQPISPKPLTRVMRGLGNGFLQFLFPPICLACGTALEDNNSLCAACWVGFNPITAPYCPVLGIPFETQSLGESVSVLAIANPPDFDMSRSAVRYNDIAKVLTSKIKYGDRLELAPFIARFMHKAGADLFTENTVLIPVPLHYSRFLQRRYNQSAVLAREVGRLANLPLEYNLVYRSKKTAQQVGLSASQRRRNIEGAFTVRNNFLEKLAGRSIIIIDDVYTTGVTCNTLARTLKRAGATNISVLTFARVLGE